jgi:hypothetical protein
MSILRRIYTMSRPPGPKKIRKNYYISERCMAKFAQLQQLLGCGQSELVQKLVDDEYIRRGGQLTFQEQPPEYKTPVTPPEAPKTP